MTKAKLMLIAAIAAASAHTVLQNRGPRYLAQ
jgi:hypothetical protein